MRTVRWCTWASALLALSISGSAYLQPWTGQTGRLFPDFALVTFDGQTTSAAAFRGRTLVLNVWATWCGPCRREMPSLQRLNETVDREQVIVIGISADSDVFRAREYVRGNGFDFARYIDPAIRLGRGALGAHVLPSTFVIAPDGRVIEHIVGPRDWSDWRTPH